MFYCDKCRIKRGWPESPFFRSLGPCELCGTVAPCNDVSSSRLPPPSSKPQKKGKAKNKAKNNIGLPDI
jgi:hypothetical protein